MPGRVITEYVARINPPGKYARVRRQNDRFGKGLDVIWGIRKGGGTQIQALRFRKEYWTPRRAAAWLRRNGFTPIGYDVVRKTVR